MIERIAHILDDEHRLFHDEILSILAQKLSLAYNSIDKVVKKPESKGVPLLFAKVRRGKFVIQQAALDKVISDLEQWQRRFDPSWYLIMIIANPVIDQQLAAQKEEQEKSEAKHLAFSPITSPEPEKNSAAQSPITLATNMRDALRSTPHQHVSIFLPKLEFQRLDIPFSNAQAAQRGGKWYIVDHYACQVGRSLSTQNDDVRRLARKLASVDPWTFGLLSCRGVVKVLDIQGRHIQGFDFIFRVPDAKEIIQSLRQNLLSGEMHHSLSRRVLIAKELAKSVNYVHNLNFVHKHICPETILLFEDLESRFSTFLVGFDNFRAADGGTNFAGDTKWERNLYRHPSRQGEFPEEEYQMQHDIYSLGVCLLEVGIWESFVSYSSDAKPKPQYGDTYQQFMKWLESTGAITTLPQSPNSAMFQGMIAPKLKEYFIYLAKTRLPITMGDKYSAVVLTCLTCLDKDNEDFGDEDQMSDEEGILVAVRFIEKILLKLDEINV